MTSKRRNPAMDIIRCLAFFSVVSVHFFLNSGFYNEIIEGKQMLVMRSEERRVGKECYS